MAVYVCGLLAVAVWWNDGCLCVWSLCVCGLLAVSVWWNDGCLCVWSLCVWSASCGSVVE